MMPFTVTVGPMGYLRKSAMLGPPKLPRTYPEGKLSPKQLSGELSGGNTESHDPHSLLLLCWGRLRT